MLPYSFFLYLTTSSKHKKSKLPKYFLTTIKLSIKRDLNINYLKKDIKLQNYIFCITIRFVTFYIFKINFTYTENQRFNQNTIGCQTFFIILVSRATMTKMKYGKQIIRTFARVIKI